MDNEFYFQTLFENLHIIMLLIDPLSGALEDANPAACSFYGYSRAELLKLNISDLTASTLKPSTLEAEIAPLEGRFRFNDRHRLANGEIRDVTVHSDPIDVGGKSLLFSIVHDDTERVRMEETLSQERDLLRTVLDHLPDNVYVKDLEGRKLLVNLKDVSTCGCATKEDLIGKTDAELFPPDIAAKFMTDDNAVLKFGQTILDHEEVATYWEGQQTWLSTSKLPLRDPSGKIIGLVGIGHDITERKLIQEDLYRSRQMLQLILDTIPQRVFWKDLSLTYLGCNHSLAADLGLGDPSQVIGKTDFEFFPRGIALKNHDDLQTVILEDIPRLNVEEPRIRPDGSRYWLRTNKLPLHDQDGKVIGILGTYEDITDHKTAEEDLKQANEKLKITVSDLELLNTQAGLLRQMDNLLQICNESSEAYAVLLQFGPQLFPSMAGALYIITNSRSSLESVAVWGENLQSEITFAPDDCWALRRGQAHMVSPSGPALKCRHVSPAFSGSYLGIPMMASGEVVGLLQLESPEINWGDPRTQELARTVTEHLALSLSNLRLRETLRSQSIRDPLTGLFNRRYMEESLERELHRAIRKHTPVGIIMLDIDHFKHFNDVFGHDAGDAVLRDLGQTIQHLVRGEDIACRYGGEEFLLIMPDTSTETTQLRAEQIRIAVKSMKNEYRQQMLGTITVSLGVAVFPEHSADMEKILKKADEMLYQAKRNGRDRVEVATG